MARNNPEKTKAYNKQYRAKNRERLNAYNRQYVKDHPERFKDVWWLHRLKHKYKITPQDFEQLLAKQGGGCAICGTKEAGARWRGGRLYVDHDHKTGKVRGLLCSGCNVALGFLRDNPDILKAMIKYLQV